MARHQNKSVLAGMTHNEYIITKILNACPFEYMKEQGIWYKRLKGSNDSWQAVW